MKERKLAKLRDTLRSRVILLRQKVQERHIKRTTLALLLAIPYLISEWSARAFELYFHFPPIDNFIHASFGIAFAAISFLIYEKKEKFIIVGALIISIIWEVIEKLGDIAYPDPKNYVDIFLFDGVKDIAVTFLGAFIMYYVLRRFVKRRYFKITVT
jgi:hypothetical protein